MGILGGILLAIATILFFIGLSPIAIFVGIIGVVFVVLAANKGKEGDAATGFVGCGCLTLVAIIVSCYFVFVDEDEEDDSSSSQTASSDITTTKQDGDLFWEHLDDGGYRVYVKGRFKRDGDGNWNIAYLCLRRSRKNGSLVHQVYVAYCSKVVPNSVNEIAYRFSESQKWVWQRCQVSTSNEAVFFGDNAPNDNRDDVVDLINAMKGKQYFVADFKDHRGRWVFAEFDITGAFAKYIDLQEGVE
jgi:hypothetical protein